VLSGLGFELGDAGLRLGVLQAQSGRFPACGRGFLGESRTKTAQLLQPVEECRGDLFRHEKASVFPGASAARRCGERVDRALEG